MIDLNEITQAKLLSNVRNRLIQNTPFTAVSPGTKARALLEAVQVEFSEQISRLSLAQVANLVSSANGDFLDLLAEIFGEKRLGIVVASVSPTAKAIKFYTEELNFGEINSNSDIVIPAGTEISTSSSGTASSSYYQTTSDVTLPSTANYFYVGAKAKLSGTKGNVEENTLVEHNFTDYTDSTNNTLLVTNPTSISYGREAEDDENFRYRIVNLAVAKAAANTTAIRLAILQTPGVADLRFYKFRRGIGTCDIIIKATTPSVPQHLIDNINIEIIDKIAAGNSILATKPRESGVQLILTMRYKEKITATDLSILEQQVSFNLRSYINNLDPGEGLTQNALSQVVLSTDARIKDLGLPGRPFDEIYVYKPSSVDSEYKLRQKVAWNYNAARDEKLLMESTIDENITIHSEV